VGARCGCWGTEGSAPPSKVWKLEVSYMETRCELLRISVRVRGISKKVSQAVSHKNNYRENFLQPSRYYSGEYSLIIIII